MEDGQWTCTLSEESYGWDVDEMLCSQQPFWPLKASPVEIAMEWTRRRQVRSAWGTSVGWMKGIGSTGCRYVWDAGRGQGLGCGRASRAPPGPAAAASPGGAAAPSPHTVVGPYGDGPSRT